MKEEKERYEIGERIRRFRRGKGLSQICFAEELGISERTLSRIENGTTPIDIHLLLKMSRILGTTLEEIVG